MQQQSQVINTQFCIVGGGMVGASCALALLKKLPKAEVVLVEKTAADDIDLSSPPHIRVSALSVASHYWLAEIGAWQYIEKMRVQPYASLRVWEKLANANLLGAYNQVSFEAREAGLNTLGYMVENQVTRLGIWQALAKYQQQGRLQILLADKQQLGELYSIENKPQYAQLKFAPVANKEQQTSISSINCQCLIAADGANSKVRQLLGIPIKKRPYSQRVLALGVELAQPAGKETWQAFVPTGPLAFLPLMKVAGKHYAVLIWYDSQLRIEQKLSLPEAELIAKIGSIFPADLPPIKNIYGRGSFPIAKMHANRYYQQRCVLVGDAAHTINPLAGQGVNLGFLDAKALIEQLLHQDLADSAALEQAYVNYQQRRRLDNSLMMNVMDLFYYGFSNDFAPAKLIRNIGMSTFARSKKIKKRALRQALGFGMRFG